MSSHMTVAENVEYGMRGKGTGSRTRAHSRGEEALEMVRQARSGRAAPSVRG